MNKPSNPTNAMICISTKIRKGEEAAPDPTEPEEEVEEKRERKRTLDMETLGGDSQRKC